MLNPLTTIRAHAVTPGSCCIAASETPTASPATTASTASTHTPAGSRSLTPGSGSVSSRHITFSFLFLKGKTSKPANSQVGMVIRPLLECPVGTQDVISGLQVEIFEIFELAVQIGIDRLVNVFDVGGNAVDPL